MNSQEFDIWIKNRLDGLEVPYNEASWSTFQKQLTEAELTQFDQEIRDKLDSFSVPTAASAWAAFEGKLDVAENIADETLDDAVREQLKDASAPNDPDAWYKFLPVLKSFETYRRRLIITKVSEFLLIFAVLFTIFNLHQHGVINVPLKKDQREQTKKVKPTIPIAKAETILPDNIPDQAVVGNESIMSSETIAHSTNIQSGQESEELLSDVTMENVRSLQLTPSIANVDFESTSVVSDNSQIDEEVIHDLVDELHAISETDHDRSSLVFTSLPFKNLGLELGDILQPQKLSVDPGLPLIKKVNKIELLAGVGFSGNLDQINTPFDEYYNIEPYQQIKGSASADVSFRAKRKRIGLRTGLGFSRKKHNPQPVYELYDGNLAANFKGTSLNSLEFDILSTALHSTYDIISRPRFSVYAMAGASLNVLASTKYERQDYEVPIKGEPMPTERDNEVNNQVIADAKSYFKGIFQGGTFKNSRFMTVDAGLGIEWKVTPRSRVFLNPVYKHMLSSDGLGPNQDNVNSLSFRAGIETLL